MENELCIYGDLLVFHGDFGRSLEAVYGDWMVISLGFGWIGRNE